DQFDLALEDLETAMAVIHAEDGVKRIRELYRIEAELRGLDLETRLNGRQERSTPLVADMQTWLVHHRARVATKSPLGEALAYIAKYWDGRKLFLTDSRIEIDTDVVEQPLSQLFCGLAGLSLQATTLAA
ncbi:transposase, partial [Rhizobium lemnae]